jgi:hypothetical protein
MLPPFCTQATVEEDLAAAVWWKGEKVHTTNSARNGDVQQFWSSSKGHSADALKDLTGDPSLLRTLGSAARTPHTQHENNQHT